MSSIGPGLFTDYKIYAWLIRLPKRASELSEEILRKEYLESYRPQNMKVSQEERIAFHRVFSAVCLIKTAQEQDDRIDPRVKAAALKVFQEQIGSQQLLPQDEKLLMNPKKKEIDSFSSAWDRINKDFQIIKNTFSELSLKDLEEVVQSLKKEQKPPEYERSLIACAWALVAAPEDYRLAPSSYYLMTPSQRVLWDHRKKIQEQAGLILNRFIEQLMKKECTLNYLDFNQEMQEFAKHRNKDHVTEQFMKDGHRYGTLILDDFGKNPILYPGKNTAEEAKGYLLKSLRNWAVVNGNFDSDLYALLQEMICQNFEKLTTEHRMPYEFGKMFGESKFSGLALIAPKKEAVSLTRIYEDHFVVAHEYTIKVRLNWDIEQEASYRVRIECPIIKKVIKNPTWTFIDKEKSMVDQIKPIPLPKLDKQK